MSRLKYEYTSFFKIEWLSIFFAPLMSPALVVVFYFSCLIFFIKTIYPFIVRSYLRAAKRYGPQ